MALFGLDKLVGNTVGKVVKPFLSSALKTVKNTVAKKVPTILTPAEIPVKPKASDFMVTIPETESQVLNRMTAIRPDLDPNSSKTLEIMQRQIAETNAKSSAEAAAYKKALDDYNSLVNPTTAPTPKPGEVIKINTPKKKLTGKQILGVLAATSGVGTAGILGYNAVKGNLTKNQIEKDKVTGELIAPETAPIGTTPAPSTQSQGAAIDKAYQDALAQALKSYEGTTATPITPPAVTPYVPPTYNAPSTSTGNTMNSGAGTQSGDNETLKALLELYKPMQYPTAQTSSQDAILQNQLNAIKAQGGSNADTIKTIYDNLAQRYQSLAGGNETFMSEIAPQISGAASQNAATAMVSPTVGNQALAASAGVSDTALGGAGFQGAQAVQEAGNVGAMQLAADKAMGLLNQQKLGRALSTQELEYNKQLLSDQQSTIANALTLAAQRAQEQANTNLAAQRRQAELNAASGQELGQTLLNRQDTMDYRKLQAEQNAADKAYASQVEAAKYNYQAQNDAATAAYNAQVKAQENALNRQANIANLESKFAQDKAQRLAQMTPAEYKAAYGISSKANIVAPKWLNSVVGGDPNALVEKLTMTDNKGGKIKISATVAEVQQVIDSFSDAINLSTGEYTDPATSQNAWFKFYTTNVLPNSGKWYSIMQKYGIPTSATAMSQSLFSTPKK
jgi:hypothetical protein